MSKRVKKLKRIQKILINIMVNTKKIYQLAEEEKDESLKSVLMLYVLNYATINLAFSVYMMKKFPQDANSDLIDKEFEKIIKPLKKQYKDKKYGK